jgi:hypothetical protein
VLSGSDLVDADDHALRVVAQRLCDGRSTFGLEAVASVFSVLWRSSSFATASVFLPAASFADADFQAIPCLIE